MLLWLASVGRSWTASTVTLLPTPNGGIQPQAQVDVRGSLHLIYFKGRPGEGDLFYVRREAGQERFSDPIRVNSRPSTAIAIGTIRGGQMALGKGGRVHVAWNGSGKTELPGRGVSMLYARLNEAGTAFEEQRDLIHHTLWLDGGGSVAADDAGNVYVAWHALKKGDPAGEGNRRVWVARSTDDGKTFTTEAPASTEPTGACGCCGMKAFADHKGTLHLLYRSAAESVNRHIYLLTSTDKGRSFQGTLVHRWKVPD
jgi:hypothetical protein